MADNVSIGDISSQVLPASQLDTQGDSFWVQTKGDDNNDSQTMRVPAESVLAYLAQGSAKPATDAAGKANEATEKANAAADNATEATGKANAAAESANTAASSATTAADAANAAAAKVDKAVGDAADATAKATTATTAANTATANANTAADTANKAAAKVAGKADVSYVDKGMENEATLRERGDSKVLAPTTTVKFSTQQGEVNSYPNSFKDGAVGDTFSTATTGLTYAQWGKYDVAAYSHVILDIKVFKDLSHWAFLDKGNKIVAIADKTQEDTGSVVSLKTDIPADAVTLVVLVRGWNGNTLTFKGALEPLKEGIATNSETASQFKSRFVNHEADEVVYSCDNIGTDDRWVKKKYVAPDGSLKDDNIYCPATYTAGLRLKVGSTYQLVQAMGMMLGEYSAAFFDINGNIISGTTSTKFTVPPGTYNTTISSRYSGNGAKVTLTCVETDSIPFDHEAKAENLYFDNTQGKVIFANNVQQAIDENRKTVDGFIPADRLNLANACMRCDLRHFSVGNGGSTQDIGTIACRTGGLKDIANYGKRLDDLPGYGATFGETAGLLMSSTHKAMFGFWVRIDNFADGDNIIFSTVSGAAFSLTKSNLLLGGEIDDSPNMKKTDGLLVRVLYPQYKGKYSYVECYWSVSKAWGQYFCSISRRDKQNNILDIYIHNYTYLVVNDDTLDINPFITYKTLPELFGSHCVGKTLCYTGDSNGGGGVGLYKRLSWAARFLGMPMFGASNGGWSMQGRVLDKEANYYGWLYYHKWRDKILDTHADIYYFNQCTNDNNGGQYGVFGNGDWDDIKKVVDTYTDEFASLLEAGNLNATYKGETLRDICHRDMTTLGCTGAFISQVNNEQKGALCIIDSTIQSIQYVNSFSGSFSPAGLVSSSVYEIDENNVLQYPPYLLANKAADDTIDTGKFITNGTMTGGAAVTAVTDSSTLTDGNNYNLFFYYLYKQAGIAFADRGNATAEQVWTARQAAHKYYEDNMGTTYGRVTPWDVAGFVKTCTDANKAYREGAANLQSILRVPFIDAGYSTNINPFNIGRYAGDAGHWRNNGMKRLGHWIATQINNLFLPDVKDIQDMWGEEYDNYWGD